MPLVAPDPLALAIHSLFLRGMAAGIVLAAIWRRLLLPGPARRGLQWAATIVFFGPMAGELILWHRSIVLVLDQEGLIAGWIVAVAALLCWKAWRALRGRRVPAASRGRPRRPATLVLAALFCCVGAAYLTSEFARDATHPRIVVEGPVTRLWIGYGTRLGHRYVAVNGQRFEATRDVYVNLRPGDWVHVEAGAGSGMLLAATRP